MGSQAYLHVLRRPMRQSSPLFCYSHGHQHVWVTEMGDLFEGPMPDFLIESHDDHESPMARNEQDHRMGRSSTA